MMGLGVYDRRKLEWWKRHTDELKQEQSQSIGAQKAEWQVERAILEQQLSLQKGKVYPSMLHTLGC